MKVVTLASSSKGNCVLVSTASTNILIDMGIPLDECEAKLDALGVGAQNINAILNTHCHGDHTKGMGAFMRKYNTNVYVHVDGRQALLRKLSRVNQNKVVSITEMPFDIGDITIEAFKVPHDAPCCVGYNLVGEGSKVSYATDLGHIDDQIVGHLVGSALVVLEANHDRGMLIANPNYPAVLKQRILGPNGHLSNEVSAQVIARLALTGTRQIVLAHLSEENNTPTLCYNNICSALAKQGIIEGTHIRIDVAPARNIGTVFKLRSN